jgi:lipoate-protein ligase A
MKFRFLNTGHRSAFENMAIDESILVHNSKDISPPTLRFYGWTPSAVSIGYFQSMHQEVDVDACKTHGADVIRRITGGGAVFHEHELTYSFICRENLEFISKNILDSYKQICGGIIKGFELMGLKADFVPLNDIAINGKKVSGNAQTRRQGCILQHGTILLKVDPEKMFSLLKVPDEKIRDKMIRVVKDRVTSVSDQLSREIEYDLMVGKMVEGFARSLDITLCDAELTTPEILLADQIAKEKYNTSEWNFKR